MRLKVTDHPVPAVAREGDVADAQDGGHEAEQLHVQPALAGAHPILELQVLECVD